ncbi:MAG: SCP2 sterol-binding domain-containing protein [Candidatus Bathyarchaeia archaeon]|jgi:putative sterol carrier protein
MEVKTPEEFFEKQLPVRFKPDKAAGIDAVIQLSLSGGQKEQDWVVVIKNQKLQITEGTNPSASLSLRISESNFLDIINGKLSAEKAFFTGIIRFQGNISVALKLRDAGIL